MTTEIGIELRERTRILVILVSASLPFAGGRSTKQDTGLSVPITPSTSNEISESIDEDEEEDDPPILEDGSTTHGLERLSSAATCLVAGVEYTHGQQTVVLVLVNSIGKPATATTFGDLAAILIDRVVHLGRSYARVDILFDRYRPKSIKSGTHCRRTRGAVSVRRDITGAAIPLPKKWKNFLALGDNMADLDRFLSQEVLQHVFDAIEVALFGGFIHEDDVRSTNPESDVSPLAATREEADTRVVMTCTKLCHRFHLCFKQCFDSGMIVFFTSFGGHLEAHALQT
ncbi:unnamed protein product [Phaedon cochleariae]|uniref:Uncharacterized protein n=1 Tax=Phaedon cochleariae TaxID=80249 RepID=A0A9N9X7S8_PHACE|nr:unnamed protein product [Phaedon cochleariae]